MPDPNALDPAALSRSARFVRFLREAVAIKSKHVLEVQKYPGVVWFSDLPTDLEEVRSPLTTPNWPASDPHWLKVARVQEPARPVPPEECKPWLVGVELDSPATPPRLNPEAEQVSEAGEPITLPASEEVRSAWERYLAHEWNNWANKAAVARTVKPIYQKLFAMQQQMQGVGDTFDLFVGVGLFHSRTNAEQPFRRHLLAFPAELVLDDRSGTLSLRAAADFVAARIETDFLPTVDKARLQPQIDGLTDDVMALGADVGDQASIGNLLTRLITPINAVTRYVPDLKPVDASVNAAVVAFGAAVILRPRSTRSLDALLRKIEKDTSGEPPRFPQGGLPVPWRKMMEDGQVWDGDPARDSEAIASVEAIVKAMEAFPRERPSIEGRPLPAEVGGVELSAAQTWLGALAAVEAVATPDDAKWSAALRQVLLRSTTVWETRLEECRAGLLPLTDVVIAATVKTEVSERTHAEARRDLARLEKHYAGGGVRRRLGILKPTVVKETEWVENAVTVESLPVQKPEEIARARRALDGWALIQAARASWRPWQLSVSDVTPRSQLAVLKSRLALLEQLLNVAKAGSSVVNEMRRWLAESLDAQIATSTLVGVVQWRLAELRLASARAHRDALVTPLRNAIKNRNVVPALNKLVEAMLSEKTDDVDSALKALKAERASREVHRRYLAFGASVRKAAPVFADAIVVAEGTPTLRAAFLNLESAWNHRRAQDWLDTILSHERIEAVHRSARNERQRAQETLALLTSARAWSEALHRITDIRRATLTAWAQAVAKIPASGPNVFLRRAQAQRLLGGCLETIPAWVVSLGRLYETISPVPGLFDVVIVDEASQCWLDSLVLFYLAKQVIIVGDDKQISPTVVGVADIEIDKLAEAFVPDLRFRSSFTLSSSLFDHGKRYLSDGVPLREHFRCVPEIIGFSNQLCYAANPLIPLRQVGRNRLEPLKRTYLPDGLRTRDINDMEARAIVDAIAACHVDPTYDDCDFGVICLQGDMQGEHIEQLLLERLGPEVFTQRHLRCGNPYAFQGDERDVMFLSMVAAPNVRQQSLTATMYEQRFNVAMSRARDQAWLFHSIQEDELGAHCLRRRVLEFFRSPPEQNINGASIDIPHLGLVAEHADRMAEKPPRPFDSWFELDVALALAAKGYTLSAQVEVAHKRIDLVIEGDEGVRLAVECDGEAWHGADRYAADLARQRQLERAEWRFVRVRESLFYSDQGRAIREIVQACEELDIAPGDGRARPSGVALRTSQASPPVQVNETPVDIDVPDAVSGLSDSVTGIGADSDEPGFAEGAEGDDFELEADLDPGRPPMNLRLPLDARLKREYPDPRTAPLATVSEAVVDVIGSYGPLTKSAIYGLYRDGCPKVERAGKNLCHAVNRALGTLERMGRVKSRDEGHRRLPNEVVYRLPDQPWMSARPSAKRDIEEIPLSELAAQILAEGGRAVHKDDMALEGVLKNVARRYGVQRFRDQARARLFSAAKLAFDAERCASIGGLE